MPVAEAKTGGFPGGLQCTNFKKQKGTGYLDFDPFIVSVVAFLEGVRAVAEK